VSPVEALDIGCPSHHVANHLRHVVAIARAGEPIT
jgi:hypothetical protein